VEGRYLGKREIIKQRDYEGTQKVFIGRRTRL
jgi:hypothetical protein